MYLLLKHQKNQLHKVAFVSGFDRLSRLVVPREIRRNSCPLLLCNDLKTMHLPGEQGAGQPQKNLRMIENRLDFCYFPAAVGFPFMLNRGYPVMLNQYLVCLIFLLK